MSSRPLPIFIDAHAVLHDSLAWSEVSRDDAIRLGSRGSLVVFTQGNSSSASRPAPRA